MSTEMLNYAQGIQEMKQSCPIHFYIHSIESGKFYINNTAKYYLKPEVYNFKGKNCSGEKNCQSCYVDLRPDQLKDRNFYAFCRCC